MPRAGNAGHSRITNSLQRSPGAYNAEQWMLARLARARFEAPLDVARALQTQTVDQQRAISTKARVNLSRSSRGH